MNIVVTVPASMPWQEYLDGVAAAHKRGEIAHFKVSNLPKDTEPGERCYIVHNGYIRGWMKIVDLNQNRTFFCSIAKKTWTGNFIDRECVFHPIDPIPMKGFQGFRYVSTERSKRGSAE